MRMMIDLRPAACAAVTALDAFGAVSATQATQLLGFWACRDELTPADIDDVPSHHGNPGAGDASAPQPPHDDPTGLTYDREPDEPTDGPLPPGVAGYSVGGRHYPRGDAR